jgi:hypothetical protein
MDRAVDQIRPVCAPSMSTDSRVREFVAYWKAPLLFDLSANLVVHTMSEKNGKLV